MQNKESKQSIKGIKQENHIYLKLPNSNNNRMKKVNKSSLLEQTQMKRVNKSKRRCSNSSCNHKCKIIKVRQSRQSPFLIMKMILNQKWQQLKCHQIHLISVKQKHLFVMLWWWLNPPDLSLQNQNSMGTLQDNKSQAKCNLFRPLSMKIMRWWRNRKTR